MVAGEPAVGILAPAPTPPRGDAPPVPHLPPVVRPRARAAPQEPAVALRRPLHGAERGRSGARAGHAAHRRNHEGTPPSRADAGVDGGPLPAPPPGARRRAG